MDNQIKCYNKLPEAARRIREEVFVREQGFENEFDEIDERAIHLVLYNQNQAAGTCRVYVYDQDVYAIGRIALMPAYRQKGMGRILLDAAEQEIRKAGGTQIHLSAQCRISAFYQKQGYQPVGEIYLDESCPHIAMEKKLI